MSEPVGNTPRSPTPGGADLPGNAHKNREAEPEPREKIEKIVEGKVVTRKLPWWKRMAHSMIADDASSISDYILVDGIVPALKNLIADIVGQGTNRVLFGSARNRGRSGIGGLGTLDSRGSLRTRYDQIGVDPGRSISRVGRARHDFDEVVLETRVEAIDVVEGLIAQVARYGFASVSDLYDLVGVTGSFQDQRWGWTDLVTADVRQVRGGFLLDLPRPEPLR